MKDDSFYLPEFEGIANVSTIADVDGLDETLKIATECQKVLSKMVSAIHRQKKVIAETEFTYELESFVMYHEYIISVLKIPSNPKLRPFRVPGTYQDCFSLIDAISRAKDLIDDFKAKGIDVRIGKGIVTEEDIERKRRR